MKINIKGTRINLRTIENSDAQDIYQNAKDYEIAKYTTLPHPYTLKHAKDFIKKTQQRIEKKENYALGIELKENKKIIGMMGLMKIDHKNKNAEIGYWLGKKYWGNGITKEAIQLILPYGFKKLKLMRIYARVMHPNTTSVKLLEKSGFKYEGRMRTTTLLKNKWMDDLRYSILKDEFKIKKKDA